MELKSPKVQIADREPLIFISYSHKDEIWKEELCSHFAESLLQTTVNVWEDRQIEPTDKWYQTIREVMANTTVAICLISPTYLRSDFCTKEEIPYLLKRREQDGMLLIFLLVSPCEWQKIPWLGERQLLPRDAVAVAEYSMQDRKRCYQDILEFVAMNLEDPGFRMPKPQIVWPLPDAVDLSRLPMTGAELFGREQELYELDQNWRKQELNVFSLVAWGGMGKSTLVNKWLERMKEENFRDAQKVFGWSFFSQGSGERVTSADLFIQTALEWFGDPDPATGSPWSKGERLAALICKQRTLLILDGMEQLQSNRDFDRGAITDPGLSVLINELSRDNKGLCVITTRESVADLVDFRSSIHETNLEKISKEAGRALLRVKGVRGTDLQLENVARSFGCNALAINLFAAYLRNIQGHPAEAVTDIPDLDLSDEKGCHPRRMMVAFEDRYGEGPELELLRITSLFDQPAEPDWVDAVLSPPAIPHLTDHLHLLSEGKWRDLLDKLRKMWLVAPQNEHSPNIIDVHPLVREHFGEMFCKQWPKSFQIAHGRLYEHFQQTSDHQPETLRDMIPLYTAISHGCKAGLYEDALGNILVPRIRRNELCYSIVQLGTFSLELAALSNFFEHLWGQVISDLDDQSAGFVQHETGFVLAALGRLPEAMEILEASFDNAFTRRRWPGAALSAARLAELYLLSGMINTAKDRASIGVELARKSQDDPATADMRFTPMQNLTTLGYILCQAGYQSEAESFFKEAELAQCQLDPSLQQLISIKHFRYCDWFLAVGKADEVINRTKYNDKLEKSLAELDCAIDGLRQAGYKEYLVLGLLARARVFRAQERPDLAQRDLSESMVLIRRGGMKLYEFNVQLESAYLKLLEGQRDEARKHLRNSTAMVADMGCHRWDTEIAELRAALE